MKEPKIRFKGFSGEWEEKNITSIASLKAGVSIDTSQEISYKIQGYYPCYGGNGLRGYVRDYTHDGIYNIIGRQGALCGNVKMAKGKFHATEHAVVVTPTMQLDPYFLFNVLTKANINQYATGVAQPGLSVQNINKSLNIYIPDFEEQLSLGAYFQHLDSLIQSTTKKIESLKQVKAASLQSMFPQEGETTPRVRFKGFEGEWVALKYDEVFSLIGDSGHNVQKTGYCERGLYPIIDQSKQYIVGYTDKVLPIDGTNGFIIFGDHTREFKYIDFPFCTGADGIRILKCEQNFDSRFIYYTCSSLYIPNTGYNRHFKYIKEATYLTPETMEEQRAIASYFSTLDRQITLQTQRLEKLKQIKSACLDNMFV